MLYGFQVFADSEKAFASTGSNGVGERTGGLGRLLPFGAALPPCRSLVVGIAPGEMFPRARSGPWARGHPIRRRQEASV